MAGRRAAAENTEAQATRRRAVLGRSMRLGAWSLLACAILLELGLRLVLGNFAQSRLLQHSEDADVCLENRPSMEITYTGWLKRVPPTHMRTNSLGARGPELAASVPAGALRVAYLGDSFTFGQGVEEEEAFATVIGEQLAARGVPVETLNFGVSGHGTPQSIALLERQVVPLQPDVVVLNVFANDLSAEDSYCLRGRNRGKRSYERWLLQNVYLVRLGVIVTSPFRQVPQVDDVAALGTPEERYRKAIAKGQALAEQHGFLFVVVLLTDASMFTDSRHCQGCAAPHALMTGSPVTTLDMSDSWRALQRDIDANFIAGEGHFTVAGNALMGAAIAERLQVSPAFQALSGGAAEPGPAVPGR